MANLSDWIQLPGGLAISRHPMQEIPDECRLATPAELVVANQGAPFPWGHIPEPGPTNRVWREHRMGYGGLIHSHWFVTSVGRFGGAPNVPQELPGSLRHNMLLDGGFAGDPLKENEGYAVVLETLEVDRDMYRRVQLHASEHVAADGGAIIVSPICEDGRVMVGFVGRCQVCPNPELISFRQLKKAVPGYDFELWPEWQSWTV